MLIKRNFEIHKNILNFTPPMAKEISKLFPQLEKAKNVVITTHAKPDGDAMGSSLALSNILIQMGHHVNVITPTDYPDFLDWLPGNDKVLIYPDKKNISDQLIANADLIFCLDFNDLGRIRLMTTSVSESKAKKIMIDHHMYPSDFDDFRLARTSASSTAELIYEFLILLNGKAELNTDISNCIYTGIMTDTGSFRFDSTTSEVHKIISSLIDQGIDVAKIHNLVYDSFSENRLRFLGHVLLNKMVLIPEHKAAYIALEKEDMEKFSLKTGDTEGVVNYPLGINGIEISAMITDRTQNKDSEKEIRLSLRSIGDFPVNELSMRYFNGGGHKNAAGGQTNTSVQETVEIFKNALKTFQK